MLNFDEMLFTRHSACHIKGEVPAERISQSAPEVMVELNAIFNEYTFQPISLFIDLVEKIGAVFHGADPIGIVEKGNPNQFDEYYPEADLVIWLHLSKNLTSRSFWAIWEYQFADSNPYKDEHDETMSALYSMTINSL
jgi:hypothetical protein